MEQRYQTSTPNHMVVHSDSTSAIACVRHPGGRPAPRPAGNVFHIVGHLIILKGRSANIHWAKGHPGIPGNGRADALAGEADEEIPSARVKSLAFLKLRISEKFRRGKIGMPSRTATAHRKFLHRRRRNPAWTGLRMPSPGRPPRSEQAIGVPRPTSNGSRNGGSTGTGLP